MIHAMEYIVYKVMSPSNKFYIGVTSQSLNLRKNWHLSESKNKNSRHYNNAFKREIRKYSNELLWTTLEQNLTREQALNKEISYITNYNSYKKGYNMTLGGAGKKSHSRSKVLVEVKSYRTVTEWRNNSRGTYEFSQRCGSPFFEKCKKHMKRKEKIVLKKYFFAKSGNKTLGTWISIKQCAEQLGLDGGAISRCLSGKFKQTKNIQFKWNHHEST